MSLRSQLPIDSAAAFLDVAAFGEPITYLPAGLPSVSINAVVLRDEPAPQPSPEVPRVTNNRVVVLIANHATLGRTAIARGDRVSLPIREGEAAKTCAVLRWAGDLAMWELEVAP